MRSGIVRGVGWARTAVSHERASEVETAPWTGRAAPGIARGFGARSRRGVRAGGVVWCGVVWCGVVWCEGDGGRDLLDVNPICFVELGTKFPRKIIYRNPGRGTRCM